MYVIEEAAGTINLELAVTECRDAEFACREVAQNTTDGPLHHIFMRLADKFAQAQRETNDKEELCNSI